MTSRLSQMPVRCEVIEIRNSADADGFPCSRTASTQCFDCGSELCENHTETCGICNGIFCPPCLSFHSAQRPKAASADHGTFGNEEGLRAGELRLRIYVFFQSVRVISSSRISCNRWSRRSWSAAAPPSLLCICVRFASDLGYFFLKFLDTLYTNFGINTA